MIESQLKLVYRRYITYAMILSFLFHILIVGAYIGFSLLFVSGGTEEHQRTFELQNLDFLLNNSKPKSSGSQASNRAKVSSDADLKKISNQPKIVADEKAADKKITDSAIVDTTAREFSENGQGNGLGRGIGQGVGDEGGEGNYSGTRAPLHANPRVRMMVQPNVDKVRNKINGTVRLRLKIDPQGNVLATAVLNNSTKDKELEEIAKKAALRMKFYPATDDGVAVEDWFDHAIIFNFDAKK